ncbi:hypothetical protein D7X33_30780 [Butyricicoccus sp. 1XD8-22]|nr:hypothetical protein D7X33_30780 [Butyricicoccus sp. 1XD8-22]
MAVSKNKKVDKKICISETCDKQSREQVLTNFYTTSLKDIFTDGRIPLCKSCCQKLFDEKGFEGFQQIMKLINKPIYEDIFKGDYGDYIRQVASLPQYRMNTYEDSDLFAEPKSISSTKVNKVKAKELSEDELNELIDFFGEGYEEKDYIYLIGEYEDYLNRYEVDSKTLENLIKEICLTQLDIRKKRASGEKVDQQQKTLQDLLGSSNLKPVQETGNQAVEQETFGTLIKRWENEKPIPEPLEEWKENDRVGTYLRVWFTGHLMRMFGLENKNEKEYYDELNTYTVEATEDGEKND